MKLNKIRNVLAAVVVFLLFAALVRSARGVDAREIGLPTVSAFHLEVSGPVRLDLAARAPGTDWSRKGAESAVVTAYVDGRYTADVVLWGGSELTSYQLYLGDFTAGEHKLALKFAPGKSAQKAVSVEVVKVGVTAMVIEDKLTQAVYKYAPILIGRNGLDNNHTDTPLAMWYQITQDDDQTTKITYGYVFSNEDGGTAANPQVEQAQWGRLTDIQRVFAVTVDAQRRSVRQVYEGLNHTDHDFQGDYDGTHAVIVTAALNNDVTDRGGGPLRFRLGPDYQIGNDEPRGELMRRHPQWFAIEEKELEREGKIEPSSTLPTTSNPSSNSVPVLDNNRQMPDPIRYVYVQYNAVHTSHSPITARVALKTGEQFYGDCGVPGVALAADGWNQTAVLLPIGTEPESIAKIDFVSRGAGLAQITQVGHVFMLSRNFAIVELNRFA